MEITRSDGYYRPFPQDKRDCKKCANLIEIGCYKSDKEYIRYKVENEIEGVGKRIRLDKHPNRFERMKKTHPKIYDYCMKPVSEGGQALDWSDEDE